MHARHAMSALLVAALLAPACAPRRVGHRAREGSAVDWAWPEVRPPGTGVTCRMPVAPRLTHQLGREEDGAFYRTTSLRAQLPYGSFGVIVTEWEGGLVGDPLEAAGDMANDLFAEQQLRERRSSRLDIAGFYGREDTGLAPNGVFVALRQFIGRDRVYVAIATVAHAPGPLAAAEQFMASIRLHASDALLPVGADTDARAQFLPETDFAVQMPPISTRRTEDLDLGDRTVVTHSFVARSPTARLRVRVIDVPGGVEPEMVERIVSRYELGEAGAPVSASGFPGQSYARSSGGVSIQGRVFSTASRVYVLEAASPATQTPSEIVRTFFDSFRIL